MSIVALVGASCSSGTGAAETTTTIKATTTTLPPTTTTIGDAEAESDLLSNSLVQLPNYTYYDYNKALVQSEVRNLNATPAARAAFSSLSRHIVAFDQHFIAEMLLLEMRDPHASLDEVMGPLTDVIDLVGSTESNSINVGDFELVNLTDDDVDAWVWVGDGVAHVSFYTALYGNEDFGADFARAFAAVEQDLPMPEAVASGIPPGSDLKVEDNHLASHLLPVGGYTYLDVEFETAVGFYAWMEMMDFVVRASTHYVLAVDDLADGEWTGLLNVQLWQITDELRNDAAALNDLLGYAIESWAKEGSQPSIQIMNINGQDVTFSGYETPDGYYTESFLFEHAGLIYVMHTLPGCDDPETDACHQDAIDFLVQFIAATEQTS